MQILQWLFKIANEPQSESSNHRTAPAAGKPGTVKAGVKVKSADTVLWKNNPPGTDRRKQKRADQSELICKNFNLFKILRTKDSAKACFYGSLNLRRPASFQRRQHLHSMKMRKEDLARGLGISSNHHKADSSSHAGNKVLPISDQTSVSSSTNENDQRGTSTTTTEKKEKTKGDKTKTMSRMKELLRWAAAAKSAEKGGRYLTRKVLYFRNKSTLKSVPDDDQLSNDSPKISFRWDVESCSTTSSAYSAISMASSTKIVDQTMSLPSLNSTPLNNTDYNAVRTGNWITTDSEFVVLEL